MKCWANLLLSFCLLAGAIESAQAKNYALLFGNSNYSIGQLDNPANDAQDLANTLRSVGFETTVKLNQDGEAMKNAIRTFSEKIRGNDGIALFFFAGHGIQANGENYLLPVGFPFKSEQDVEKNAVPANMVLRYLEDSKNRVNLIVLDSCRNNPFIKTRSLKTRGLAPMDAPSGSLIAFSTAPGTEASDGSGRNGLYTQHLMANMKVPGLTIEQLFKRTREGVENESEKIMGRKQSPREESSLKGGDMYFVPPVAKESTADPASVELAYWNSIANSSNPADFESYLTQYPQGKFAGLAKNRVNNTQTKMASVGRPEARAVTEEQGSPSPRIAMVKPKPGKVYSSPKSFSFDDDEDGAVKAAEFLSISCRDSIRNKRVRLQINSSAGSDLFRSAVEKRLNSVGVKVAASGGAADFVMKGVIEVSGGVNRMTNINEVDFQADFTLALPSGKRLSSAAVNGSSFAGSNVKGAVRNIWEEKSEEMVGRLFGDFCSVQ